MEVSKAKGQSSGEFASKYSTAVVKKKKRFSWIHQTGVLVMLLLVAPAAFSLLPARAQFSSDAFSELRVGEAYLSSEPACFECNTDYNGYDVSSVYGTVDSLYDCRQLCLTLPACQFFTFAPSWRSCYLKSSDQGRKSDISQTLGLISGPRDCTPATSSSGVGGTSFRDTNGCVECNTDYFGNDLSYVSLSLWAPRSTEENGDDKVRGGDDDEVAPYGFWKPELRDHAPDEPTRPGHSETGPTTPESSFEAIDRRLAAFDYVNLLRGAPYLPQVAESPKQRLSRQTDAVDISNQSSAFLECKAICDKNDDCTHFTFVPLWQRCYLKYGQPQNDAAVVNPATTGFVSYVKDCFIETTETAATDSAASITPETISCLSVDTDFFGNDLYAVPSVSTATECQALCYQRYPCQVFTFVPYTEMCYLKYAKTLVVSNGDTRGLISGPRECPESASGLGESGVTTTSTMTTTTTTTTTTSSTTTSTTSTTTSTTSATSCSTTNISTTAATTTTPSADDPATTTAAPAPSEVEGSLKDDSSSCLNPRYELVKEYTKWDFFREPHFNFYTADDPTGGFVNYVERETAFERGYVDVVDDHAVISTDTTRKVSPESRGRDSVRIVSQDVYDEGLWVMSLNHMPTGCGTWPAYWLVGDDPWPSGGEVDIMEGANLQEHNHVALHTNAGCHMWGVDSNAFDGHWSLDESGYESRDCYYGATLNNYGCAIDAREKSFGEAFNIEGGGLIVAEVDRTRHIRLWYFRDDEVPADLSRLYHPPDDATYAHPDPSMWTKSPMAHFPLGNNCNGGYFFHGLRVVLNMSFCGGFAGYKFLHHLGCPGVGIDDCVRYVRDEPEAFVEAYWNISYLKIFQLAEEDTTTCSAGASREQRNAGGQASSHSSSHSSSSSHWLGTEWLRPSQYRATPHFKYYYHTYYDDDANNDDDDDISRR